MSAWFLDADRLYVCVREEEEDVDTPPPPSPLQLKEVGGATGKGGRGEGEFLLQWTNSGWTRWRRGDGQGSGGVEEAQMAMEELGVKS